MLGSWNHLMLRTSHQGVKAYALAIVAFLLLLLFCPSLAYGQSPVLPTHLSGVALAIRGDIKGGAAQLRKIGETQRSPEVVASLGLLELAQGHLSKGQKALKAAVKADQTLAEAHFWIGIAALRGGRAQDAAKALDVAVSLRADRPEYRLGRGLARGGAGQREGALADIVAAAKVCPNLHEPFLHPDEQRGLIRLAERALRTFPHEGPVNEMVIRLLADAGLVREAERRAKKSPQSGVAREVLGLGAFRDGDMGSAHKHLLQASRLSPKSSNVLFHLSRVEYKNGARVKALARLKQAARLAPGDPKVLTALGDLHLEQGNLDDAELAFGYSIGLKGGPAALVGHGRVLELRGDLKAAEKRYREAIHLAPAEVEPLERLASVLDRQKAKQKAKIVRRKSSKAARIEADFQAKVGRLNKGARAHAALCEKLMQHPEIISKIGNAKGRSKAALAFAQASAYARQADQQSKTKKAAATLLARLPPRKWAAGARRAYIQKVNMGSAVALRVAVLDFVILP